MPDVGLFTAAEPLDPGYRVIIKYSVEVEGLPVYQESLDVKTLEREFREDPARMKELWFRRILCVVGSRPRHGFSASLTRCLMDGQCGEFGHAEPVQIDTAGTSARA